jgi:valyl-tRNA synthetase
MNENAPPRYRGLDRFEARDAIIKEMESLGLFDKVEDNPMTVPHGDRSGVVVEPWLLEQWFVDAKTLAEPAIRAVEEGRTKFVPANWAKTYYEWMRNIQPWCVSRQLWWGHQIPAWYGPDGAVFVELTEEEAQAAAAAQYGHPVQLRREEDVLDTWFSSALWPFSTLGWPDDTPEVQRNYPTDVLVTAFDIIFFWVARMMMMGIHFMDEPPFHTVYIHAIVRDEHGQKMSKTKGNVIDPLELIDSYGADAMRFTLTALAAQGRDIQLSTSRVEGYRNFCTKLWNAARFCEINQAHPIRGFDPTTCTEPVNRWLVGELAETANRAAEAIEAYRFNDFADAVYQFTWRTFCDWYLEFIKPAMLGGSASEQAEVRATAGWALEQILKMLHPVMPFVTEELYQSGADRGGEMLIEAEWPALDRALRDATVAAELDWVIRLVSLVRSVRTEMGVPPGATIPLFLKDADDATLSRLKTHAPLAMSLARISSVDALAGDVPAGSVQDVLDGATVILPVADVIDVDAEKARLTKEIGKLDGDIAKFEKKLGNAGFLAKAPPEVVETERGRLNDALAARSKLNDAASRLAAL